MKFEIFKFATVTSTNDIAMNMIKKKGNKSGCIYAEEQSNGRGNHGKKWISCKGNLFSSIFFPLEKKYPSIDEFSTINPVIILNSIKHLFKKQNISFKWPNDILVNEKKICGILQEVIISNGEKFLIIGIGLNVISNPIINSKYRATNILAETKINISITGVMSLIISSYEDFFLNINSYNYKSFKTKIDLMTLNSNI